MNELKFKEIFATPYFNIESTDFNYSENSPYYRITTQPSVICCLINELDEILLVRQFRPNLGYKTLEFPAGGLNNYEAPEDGLIREIKEEIGVSCRPIFLGAYRLMMNRTTNAEYLFVALTSGTEYDPQEEGIRVVKIKRRELFKAILTGEIEQMASLAILQLINLKFGINFLQDNNIIDKIWGK
jgi:8-oxo-dGTP pyrophosphatase MutT (NUDIX family)